MASAQFIHPIIRINGVSFFFYRIIGTNGGTSVFHEIIGINGGNRCVYSLNFLGPFTNQPTRIHPHPQGINIQIIKIPHMIQHINPLNYVHLLEPVKIWQSTEKCPTRNPPHHTHTKKNSSQFMHTKPLFG